MGERIPICTIGTLEPFRTRIKSLRDEFLRLRPFSWIHMNLLHVDQETIFWSEFDSTNRSFFLEIGRATHWKWSVEAEDLKIDHLEHIKFFDNLSSEFLLDIVFDWLEHRIDLCSKFVPQLSEFCKMSYEICSCSLDCF